jgi:hypothetical protein
MQIKCCLCKNWSDDLDVFDGYSNILPLTQCPPSTIIVDQHPQQRRRGQTWWSPTLVVKALPSKEILVPRSCLARNPSPRLSMPLISCRYSNPVYYIPLLSPCPHHCRWLTPLFLEDDSLIPLFYSWRMVGLTHYSILGENDGLNLLFYSWRMMGFTRCSLRPLVIGGIGLVGWRDIEEEGRLIEELWRKERSISNEKVRPRGHDSRYFCKGGS